MYASISFLLYLVSVLSAYISYTMLTNTTIYFFKQMEGSSLESFLIIGRVSSEAVIESKLLRSRSFLSRVQVWFEEFLLEARLFGMQMALWLLKLQKTLTL